MGDSTQATSGPVAVRFVGRALKEVGLEATVQPGPEQDGDVVVRVAGDSRALSGRRELLGAVELLASQAVSKATGQRSRVTFDLGGDRDRREEFLVSLAHDVSEAVARTGRRAVIEQLGSSERRIVHTALGDQPKVQTRSEGREERRYLLVEPGA